MATTTFDTHEVYLSIKKAGLTDQQAEGIYEAIKIAHSSSELATKGDIDLKIAQLKIQLIIWMSGIAVFAVTTGVSFIVWFIENHSKI